MQENKNLSIPKTKAAYGGSHAFNWTMWAEAGGSLWAQGQPGLYRVSLHCVVRHCLKNKTTKKITKTVLLRLNFCQLFVYLSENLIMSYFKSLLVKLTFHSHFYQCPEYLGALHRLRWMLGKQQEAGASYTFYMKTGHSKNRVSLKQKYLYMQFTHKHIHSLIYIK